MLASVLQFWGFEVRTAHTAQAALALVAEWRPDAAVLDIGLPNASGNDLARRRLRHQPWGRDMLMVAVTGWGHDQDRDRTAEPASMVTWSSPSIRSRCAVSSEGIRKLERHWIEPLSSRRLDRRPLVRR